MLLDTDETDAMAGGIGGRGDLDGEPLAGGGWRLLLTRFNEPMRKGEIA